MEHRLKPGLRLKTEAGIIKFIHDRGLVSALGGNELPSFISAVLGEPWQPSAKGFTGWLDWWSIKISGQSVARVSGNIARRNDVVATRIFKRTSTFVSNKIWPILDPIVKHHRDPAIEGQVFSDLELKILDTIESESSIRTDNLRKKLNLKGKENNSKFHRSLTHLERYSLIVGAEDPHPEKHLHANIWQTWDNRTKGGRRLARFSYVEALARLLVKTVDACVFAHEDEIPTWFEWSSDMQQAKDQALQDGTILKSGPYLVSPKVLDVKN